MSEIRKTVWVAADGGIYEIPADLRGARITKSGWPDKRDALYPAFMEWASSLNRPIPRVEGADVEPVEVVNTVEAFLAEPLEAPRSLEPSGPNPFALAFAKAVWANQSPDEPRKWRLERVALAMQNRGFSMEGIEL